MLQLKSASLEIHPKESLLDEPLKIVATGLESYERYTLTAYCQPQNGHPGFSSHGHYVANNDGVIDVGTMTSYGGTYAGIEPMGLIWSMQSLQKDEKQSFALRNPIESFEITYSLYGGHLITPVDAGGNPIPIAQCVGKRLAVAPNVQRIPIREGRIRGTLFVPHGKGPFRGVVDIDGINPHGVIFEKTASLLASRGYISLALVYQDYDDLPDLHHLELEYFIEAVEWFASHPLVSKSGLTIFGECFGGVIALYLSLNCKLVNTVIIRNTFSYVAHGTVNFKGHQLPKFGIQVKHASGRTICPPVADWTLPIEKVSRDIHFLFLVGEDDLAAHPGHTGLLIERLKNAGHHNYKVVSYPWTGHIISLPYCPHEFCSKGSTMTYLFGGEMYAHVRAQESAWPEILRFMEKDCQRAKL